MKRTAKNALFLFTGEIATRLLGFLVSTLLARRLNIASFGQVAFAFSVMSYGIILTKFGLLTVGIREASQNRNVVPVLVNNMLTIRLVLGLVAAVGIAVFAVCFRPEVKWLLVVSAGVVLLQSLFLDWLFVALEKMGFLALTHFLINALYLVLVATFVKGDRSLSAVPVAYAIAMFAAVLLLLSVYIANFRMPRLSLDPSIWRKLMFQSWPVGLAEVLTQIYVNFGVVGLSLLRSDDEAGLYAASHRLVFFLLMLDRVLQTLFLPLVSRIYAAKPDQLAELLGTAIRLVISLGLPLAVAFAMLSKPLLGLIFGARFAPASTTLSILVWFLPLSLLSTLAGYLLLAAGKERIFLSNTVIGVSLAIAISLPGILFLGPSAAAIAMVVGEMAILVLMARQALRICRPAIEPRILVPFLGSVSLVFIILVLRSWSWPIAAIAGAFFYFAVLFVGRGLTLSDLGLVGK